MMRIHLLTLNFIATTLFFSVAVTHFACAETALQQNTSGEKKITFMPPEVAIGTVSCKAAWNEFCEDQKTIKVPDGHKLCKSSVTVKEQTGDSAYEVVSTDNQGVTLKFHAKGNRDRFKQQSASIVLGISLSGVRDNTDCITGMVKNPLITPPPESIDTAVAVSKVAEPKVTETKAAEPKVVETGSAEKAELKPVTTVTQPSAPAATNDIKPHACACSKWIDADKVFNCLVNGRGRDNVTCDSYATTIQCVTSKEECHESQKENCPQVMGLNRSESNKRLFVNDSPFCKQH